MRVAPALGLSAALTLLMSGCRTQTGIDVEITTDIRCGTTPMSTGVQLGELTGAEITGESPQVVTQACTEGVGVEPSRVGDIVVTASPGNDSATFRLTVMANLRLTEGKEAISPEKCKAQNYVDCIVVRRTLGFVPHESLTLPIFLQNACANHTCEEGKTCVADADVGVRCVSSQIEQPTDCGSKPDGCVLPGPGAKPEDPEAPPVAGSEGGSSGDTTMPPTLPLYAATADSFFKVDPESLNLGPAIQFNGCGTHKNVHDIAVTDGNKMYAVTPDALYEVDPEGKCSQSMVTTKDFWPSSVYPYALAVLPSGIIRDATGDVLIGQYNKDFLIIDPLAKTLVPNRCGLFSSCPDASGDIVVVKTATEVKAYLTAKGSTGDYLTQIDPSTGKEVKGATRRPFSMNHVTGLAYWGGFFYGFTTDGIIAKMDEKDGKVVATVQKHGFQFMGGASPAAVPTSP